MQRYLIESVAFAPELDSIMVRFEQPHRTGGPIVGERLEWEISLRGEDGDLRTRAWNIVDELCDILDEAFAERRRGR